MNNKLQIAVALGTLGIAMTSAPTVLAEAQNTIRLEEIIVTAQKREQNLQEVPIAVTALSRETLEVNRIDSLINVGAVAPGFYVRHTTGGLLAPQISSRGVVSNGGLPGADKASPSISTVSISAPTTAFPRS